MNPPTSKSWPRHAWLLKCRVGNIRITNVLSGQPCEDTSRASLCIVLDRMSALDSRSYWKERLRRDIFLVLTCPFPGTSYNTSLLRRHSLLLLLPGSDGKQSQSKASDGIVPAISRTPYIYFLTNTIRILFILHKIWYRKRRTTVKCACIQT